MDNETEDDDKLPPNWIKRISKQKSCGRPYYVNLDTKEVSWKRPKSVRDIHSLHRSSMTISRKDSKSDTNPSTPAQDRLLALRNDLVRQQIERLKPDKSTSSPAQGRLLALQRDLISKQKQKMKEKKDSKCLVESRIPAEKRQWNDKKIALNPVTQTKGKQKVRRDFQQVHTKSTPIPMSKSNDYESECNKTNNNSSNILTDITWTSISTNPSPSTMTSSSFSSSMNSSNNSSSCLTDAYNQQQHKDNYRGTNQRGSTCKPIHKADPTNVHFIDDSSKPPTFNKTNGKWIYPPPTSATCLFEKFETKKFSANDRLKNIRENVQFKSPTGIQSTIHKSPSSAESGLFIEDVIMAEQQISTNDDSQPEKMDWDDAEIFEEISLIRRADDCLFNVDSVFSNNSMDAPVIVSSKLLCIVIDTNIFLSQMMFLKNLQDKIDEIPGSPKLIIPYVVLQELDKLKTRTERAVSLLASRAIRFINTQLNLRNDKILGQSAIDHQKKLIEIDSADDNIINCCLQFKQTYGHVILLTNDINLRNKSMCSSIESFSNGEFESKFFLQSSKS